MLGSWRTLLRTLPGWSSTPHALPYLSIGAGWFKSRECHVTCIMHVLYCGWYKTSHTLVPLPILVCTQSFLLSEIESNIMCLFCSGQDRSGMTSSWGRTPSFGAQTPMVGSMTPSYGSMTPMHGGGRTPLPYGSQTPMHDGKQRNLGMWHWEGCVADLVYILLVFLKWAFENLLKKRCEYSQQLLW